jgi:hypothetical protein
MIDEQRAEQWTRDARVALVRYYGEDDTAAHLAAIALALVQDRLERERYIEREGGNMPVQER